MIREYSDGSANEQAVLEALKRSEDVSVRSQELEGSWTNWAQQAHLSSQRVNLIDRLNWKRAASVLEVGCGCGALTRYLGESGMTVDAIEVSPRRAAIARERCRGLDNVSIFCANLNDLVLPKNKYGYVMLVGVMEYAARFSRAKQPVDVIVRELLSRFLTSLEPQGIVFIAIENRLGFKYISGACEDHYGVPRVGVYNYPAHDCETSERRSGIYTFDTAQWREILDSIDDTYYEFFYPFPDYKLPEVVLHEEFVRRDSQCYQVLNRVHSHDYCADWAPEIEESFYWQAAAQCGQLDKTANSLGILLGRDEASVFSLIPYDFVRFGNNKRRPAFRVCTYKPRGVDKIVKELISCQQAVGSTPLVEHKLDESRYVQGKILSDIWAEALNSLADEKLMTDFVEEYYKYLQGRSTNGLLRSLDIDLLPFNLIVDEAKTWHPMDMEWSWRRANEVTVDFVLFRSLLYFAYVHGDAIANSSTQSMVCVGDFVRFGFAHLELEYEDQADQFHTLENEFQSTVLNDWAYQPVEVIEHQPLEMVQRFVLPGSCVDVYWAFEKGSYSAKNAVTEEYTVYPGQRDFKLTLPEPSNLRGLRIDPVDHRLTAGYRILSIAKISLDGTDGSVSWDSADDIIEHANTRGMSPVKGGDGEWFVTSPDPQIIFGETALSGLGKVYGVAITLSWPDRSFQRPLQERVKQENQMLVDLLNTGHIRVKAGS